MGNCCSGRSRCGKSFSEKYKISGVVLGVGAFGVVKRCTKRDTKKRYAVKIARLSEFQLNHILHIITENKICPRLKHENIVRYHEGTFEGNSHYTVYEEIRGRCILDEVRDKKHYSERDARNYMQQILSAIQYCHERNIVHRDVRPANILLRPSDDRIKLIDFGLAVITRGDEKDQFGQVGTLLYIAPEIFENSPYGKPVDMWACGLLLYNLLTGLHPYVHVDLEYPRQLEVDYDVSFLTGVRDSPAAWSLVRNLICRDDNQRFTADGALDHKFITKIGNSSDAHRETTISNLKIFQGLLLNDTYSFDVIESPLGSDFKQSVPTPDERATKTFDVEQDAVCSTPFYSEVTRSNKKETKIDEMDLSATKSKSVMIGEIVADMSDQTDVGFTDIVSVASSSSQQHADSCTRYTILDVKRLGDLSALSPSERATFSECATDISTLFVVSERRRSSSATSVCCTPTESLQRLNDSHGNNVSSSQGDVNYANFVDDALSPSFGLEPTRQELLARVGRLSRKVRDTFDTLQTLQTK